MKSRRVAFWILLVVTLAVYVVMINWSLPLIAERADGLRPFDLRPIGYDFDEAKAFLAALKPEGAEFYLGVQHKLDSIYPALLAATLFFAIVMIAAQVARGLALGDRADRHSRRGLRLSRECRGLGDDRGGAGRHHRGGRGRREPVDGAEERLHNHRLRRAARGPGGLGRLAPRSPQDTGATPA